MLRDFSPVIADEPAAEDKFVLKSKILGPSTVGPFLSVVQCGGKVHVFYADPSINTSSSDAVKQITSTDGGATWGVAQTVPLTVGLRIVMFRAAGSSDGKIHALWVIRKTGEADTRGRVLYKSSGSDGVTWSAAGAGETTVDDDDTGGVGRRGLGSAGSINIAVEDDDTVHLVYRFDGHSISPYTNANSLEAIYYQTPPFSPGNRIAVDSLVGTDAVGIHLTTPAIIALGGTAIVVYYHIAADGVTESLRWAYRRPTWAAPATYYTIAATIGAEMWTLAAGGGKVLLALLEWRTGENYRLYSDSLTAASPAGGWTGRAHVNSNANEAVQPGVAASSYGGKLRSYFTAQTSGVDRRVWYNRAEKRKSKKVLDAATPPLIMSPAPVAADALRVARQHLTGGGPYTFQFAASPAAVLNKRALLVVEHAVSASGQTAFYLGETQIKT